MIKIPIFRNVFIIGIIASSGGAYFWYKQNHTKPSPSRSMPVFSLDQALNKDPLVEVAIIGSGAAGLSAAVYTTRAQLHTIVFQGKQPGGQLTSTSYVENWPGLPKMLGRDIMKGLQEQAEGFGAHVSSSVIEKIDFSSWPYVLHTNDGLQLHAFSVILATGAEPKRLGVKGEQEYWGRGVTTCAICDAPFYKGRDVIVLGGGDSAAEEALQLAPYAAHVTILIRSDHMRASQAMQARLKEQKHITIKYNVQVAEILGNDEHVTGVTLKTGNSEEVMPVDGVFLAIGHEPNSALIQGSVACDQQGYIILENQGQKTSLPGVFAAGDVADHRYRQAGVAAGDGIKAALDAERFLREEVAISSFGSQLRSAYFAPEEHVDGFSIPLIESVQDLETRIAEAQRPIIIDFYAPYCPDCMYFLPTVEKIATRYIDQVDFLKVDLAKLPELAQKYEVYSIPCLFVLKNGVLLEKIQHVLSKDELIALVEKYRN
jgi:thioredoxin reductase (NADPH)